MYGVTDRPTAFSITFFDKIDVDEQTSSDAVNKVKKNVSLYLGVEDILALPYGRHYFDILCEVAKDDEKYVKCFLYLPIMPRLEKSEKAPWSVNVVLPSLKHFDILPKLYSVRGKKSC